MDKTIGDNLHWIFTYVFFPAIILTTFISLCSFVCFTISNAIDSYGVFRRSVGAILPLILLVFLIAASPDSNENLKTFLAGIPVGVQLGIGVLSGVSIVEMARSLKNVDSDAQGAVFALFASTIGAFMLYCFMQATYPLLGLFLLGLIVCGGLDIIFRK